MQNNITVQQSKRDITNLMNRYERTISAFNTKYNFNTEELGSPAEIKDYNMALRVWDKLKAKRDKLN